MPAATRPAVIAAKLYMNEVPRLPAYDIPGTSRIR